MESAFTLIGIFTCLWWFSGLLMLATMKMDIPDEVPWKVRIYMAIHSGFVLPYVAYKMGGIPTMGGIMPSGECNCPRCKARRGEAEND